MQLWNSLVRAVSLEGVANRPIFRRFRPFFPIGDKGKPRIPHPQGEPWPTTLVDRSFFRRVRLGRNRWL